MPRGGKREGAGRRKGVANVATETLKERARRYTDKALQTLADICEKGESEAARVSAANSLLDRGYGKAATVLAGDEDGGAVRMTHRIELVPVEPDADAEDEA